MNKENTLRNEMAANELISETLSQTILSCPYSREYITKWTNSGGWQFEDFAIFVKLIGIKQVLNYNRVNSFECLDNTNKYVQILLCSGDETNYPEILLIDEVTESYTVNENCTAQKKYITNKYSTNRKAKKEQTVPQVFLSGRNIAISGKNNLDSNFSSNSYHFTLTIPGCQGLFNAHKLVVEINDSSINTNVLADYQLIETYLLSLSSEHFMLNHVYERVMGLLRFATESNCKKVSFSYIDKNGETLSTICKKGGQMQEYAILEDGKTYHVWKNGDWKYHSKNITLFYSKKKDTYNSCLGSAGLSDVIIENPANAFQHIKTKIYKLMNFAFCI